MPLNEKDRTWIQQKVTQEVSNVTAAIAATFTNGSNIECQIRADEWKNIDQEKTIDGLTKRTTKLEQQIKLQSKYSTEMRQSTQDLTEKPTNNTHVRTDYVSEAFP